MEGDGKRWKAPTDLVTAEDSDAFMDAFVCHTAMRSNSYATIQPACMLVNVFARRFGQASCISSLHAQRKPPQWPQNGHTPYCAGRILPRI